MESSEEFSRNGWMNFQSWEVQKFLEHILYYNYRTYYSMNWSKDFSRSFWKNPGGILVRIFVEIQNSVTRDFLDKPHKKYKSAPQKNVWGNAWNAQKNSWKSSKSHPKNVSLYALNNLRLVNFKKWRNYWKNVCRNSCKSCWENL